MFLKHQKKFVEKTSVVKFVFYRIRLANSIQSTCSKQILVKLLGTSVSPLKKGSTLDILPGSLQKISEQLTNADADADAEMPTPRFPNCHVFHISKSKLKP